MKLYVVQWNVYLESYGDYRNIFGVYDDKIGIAGVHHQ